MINLNDLIGKKFNEDGYGPDEFSCYGLAVEVFKRYGLEIPKTNISVCACKEVSEAEIDRHIHLYWQEVRQPCLPCVVLIASQPGFAQHIGIHIGNRQMIHVSKNRNVCVDKIKNWEHRIVGYYQYVGSSN